MKNSIKLFAITLIASLTVSSSSFALGAKALNDTALAVEETAKKDWMLLAKQSEYLMKRNTCLSTAKERLEQSLEIKEDAYNLELMGDYYQANNNDKKAIKYYIKAMEAMKADDATIDTKVIQSKIVLAKN